VATAVTDARGATALDADVVVIGGGIAGLVVAWETARAGLRVIVCEAGAVTGGMLRRGRVAGLDVDLGAESFATRTTGVADLVADARLALETVAPRPAGAHLVFAARGRLRRAPLPRRALLGLPADPAAADVARIIGVRAVRRAQRERDLPPPTGEEPSLAELAAARYGARVAERLVEPLCRSVYSQSASDVRLSALHPVLWAAFRSHGSLSAAVDAVAPHARAGAAVAGIAGGMWRLADALRDAAEQAGAVVWTESPVASLRPSPAPGQGAAEVRLAGRTLRAAHIVVATGPAAAGRVLATTAAAPAGGAVRLVTVEVVSPRLDAHPVGSGVIVAPDARPALRPRPAAKAMTHIDAKWPWAGAGLPPHTHILRLSARDADTPTLDTPAAVASELRRLTGVPVRTAAVRSLTETRWPDAVTTASADAAAWRAEAAAAAATGIHVTGAAVAGTGLASVIPHARALARTLVTSRLAH